MTLRSLAEQALIADLSKPDNWDKAQKEIARTLHIFRDYCEGELSQSRRSDSMFFLYVYRHEAPRVEIIGNAIDVYESSCAT